MHLRHQLYRELFEFVLHLLPHLPHTARKRLVYLIFGILLAKSIVLSRMATAQSAFWAGSIDVESHERRLRRIENDVHLRCETYALAVRRIVKWRRAKQVLILIDESGHSDVLRALVAAFWYRGRAPPWPGCCGQPKRPWRAGIGTMWTPC